MILKQKQATELIAIELGFSYRHVYDRYFHLPSFPRPILLPSATGKKPTKRWKEEDVREWITEHSGV